MMVPASIVSGFGIVAAIVPRLRVDPAVIAGVVVRRIVHPGAIHTQRACGRRDGLSSDTAAAGRVDHAQTRERTGLGIGSEDERSGAERGCRSDCCEFDVHVRRLTNANAHASAQR
jgi:hypothetical protein